MRESTISFNILVGITSNSHNLDCNFANVLTTWDLSNTLNSDNLNSTSDTVSLNKLYPSKALWIFTIFWRKNLENSSASSTPLGWSGSILVFHYLSILKLNYTMLYCHLCVSQTLPDSNHFWWHELVWKYLFLATLNASSRCSCLYFHNTLSWSLINFFDVLNIWGNHGCDLLFFLLWLFSQELCLQVLHWLLSQNIPEHHPDQCHYLFHPNLVDWISHPIPILRPFSSS